MTSQPNNTCSRNYLIVLSSLSTFNWWADRVGELSWQPPDNDPHFFINRPTGVGTL
jgi:hypothetical protein